MKERKKENESVAKKQKVLFNWGEDWRNFFVDMLDDDLAEPLALFFSAVEIVLRSKLSRFCWKYHQVYRVSS